jgi:PhzF family phenazine biosynthesis protein
MKLDIYQVDAFTDTPLTGNPAGVVPRADGLDVNIMQKIAREMNVSETVFIFHEDLPRGSTYRVQFFTPAMEIDYCGHATIAAAHLLRELKMLPDEIKTIRQAMNRETWYVREAEGLIWILHSRVRFRPTKVNHEELTSHLGLEQELLYKVTWASTGSPVLLCEISNRESLDSLKPDWNKLADFSREQDVTGLHCYALESHDKENHISARFFAPAVGVNEDPATGSTTGPLAMHILRDEKVKPEDGILRIEQGIAMGRPSLLFARRAPEPDSSLVEVGGKALTVLSGVIHL